MGRMRFAAVGMKRDRDFGYVGTVETGLNNHFGGEFHSLALKFQSVVQLLE